MREPHLIPDILLFSFELYFSSPDVQLVEKILQADIVKDKLRFFVVPDHVRDYGELDLDVAEVDVLV